ncbi:MAG: putative tRNA sulfurtransferase [Candidatus Thorarchaeota archaeon]|nr:MAG: putative tRNA sulfurtransferase [Candidatus Thorarchaeota archaeon]
MMKPEYSAVLVRYGEIGIKSKQTRKRMTALLARNIRSAIKENKLPIEKIRREWGRIFIETSEPEMVAEITARVFGVVSCSPVAISPATIDAMLDVGFELAQSEFKEGLSFAVGARRIGNHTFSSQDIREQLGAKILMELPELDLSVDLSSPQQTVYVEVRNERAYLFAKTVEGVGGMPTGTQGKVVCTVSTGLDSPIAAFKVMKRGCIPIFVYFDNTPHSQEACTDLAIRQAQVLADYIYGFEVKLYIIPHGPDLDVIKNCAVERATCIHCKRNMLRLAREIAILEDADAIVTGEILGEQASQTSHNLRVISSAVCDYPILRPCVGDDKVEILEMARNIGTYKFAEEAVSCCSLAPQYPLLHAKLIDIEKSEKEMDLSILHEEVKSAQIEYLRRGRSEPRH